MNVTPPTPDLSDMMEGASPTSPDLDHEQQQGELALVEEKLLDIHRIMHTEPIAAAEMFCEAAAHLSDLKACTTMPCAITAPSLYHHHTVAAPPYHHCTITPD